MKSKSYKPLDFSEPAFVEESETLDLTPEAAPAADPAAEPEPAAAPAPVPAPPQVQAKAPTRAARAPVEDGARWTRWAYPAAFGAALAWAGGLTAFVLGFQSRFGAFDYEALQWVVVACLAVLPAVFILLAAFAVRQGARLATETRRARALADDLAIPAALAADQTAGAMEAMRLEIEKASAAAVQAQDPIAALREALSVESRRLAETAAEAQETGRRLAESLGRERAALGELAGALQAQAAEAAEALTSQTRIVADASDLAQAQLHEAQAALAARAADLAIAAADAGEAATLAGDQLARQVQRLETAGESLTERMNRLQLSISSEREEVMVASEGLRLDQEDMAARLESRRAQLALATAEAKEGSVAIGEAVDASAEALRTLIAGAAEEVRRLAEAAQREQDALDARARETVGLFSGAVAEERDSLEAQTRAAIDRLSAAAEEARRAAAGHVEAAAEAAAAQTEAARVQLDLLAETTAVRVDHLSEAAFAAGQKADDAFEARMSSARRMIDESSLLIEEAGQRSTERIEVGLASTRTTLDDIRGLLAEIDSRFEALPEEARTRAEAVREAVERGVGDVTAAARKVAEDTQAIDTAFQERVRRNYEVLAEAVRVMGRVAAGAPGANAAAPPAPAAPVKAAAPPPEPEPEPEPEPAAERPPVELRPAVAVGERAMPVPSNDTSTPPDPLRPAALSEPVSAAAAAGLRPRLRLTTPVEDAMNAMFEPQSRREGSAEADGPHVPDEWTWKDLLASMDEPVDDEALAEKLIREITTIGIDTGALLPRGKIDEIAAVLQGGDAAGAREVVRRIAPAAVRRLSRRVLTDKVLRAEADRYVRKYQDLLEDAAERDRDGHMTATLLGSEPGRAFLLLDAAVGDLH